MMTIAEPLPARQLRHAGIADVVGLLQAQRRVSHDLVVPAPAIMLAGGNLAVGGVDPILRDDGVLDINGSYRLTATADTQLGDKFGIPRKYMRLMRDKEFVSLLDTNVNAWAAHECNAEKKILIRLLAGDNPDDPGCSGIVRAVLSDSYGALDHLDTLMAVLDGIRDAGLTADQLRVTGDLTDDKMFVVVDAPEITANGEALLEGYRSPFRPAGEVSPIVSAGLVISNSETGQGSRTITPRLTVLACNNGLQVTKDSIRRVHLGSRLDEGTVVWSNETRAAANLLARNQAKDAVKAFLDPTYVQAAVDAIAGEAATPVADIPKTIEVVSRQMGYTDAEASSILNFFVDGGQRTAGGVLQAVTAFVQELDDAERAFELEAGALDAMRVAAGVR